MKTRTKAFFSIVLLSCIAAFWALSGQSIPAKDDVLLYKCLRCYSSETGDSFTVTSESLGKLLTSARPLTFHDYKHGFHRIADADVTGLIITKTLRLYRFTVSPDGVGHIASPLGLTNYFSHEDGLVRVPAPTSAEAHSAPIAESSR
jgi:hypothetical protein